jgi:hypothetical protein
MRNFGALILAALYLMLTSGISTCFFHCCCNDAELANTSHELKGQNKGSCDEDHCKDEPLHDTGYYIKSKGCDCCDQQGALTVKENIAGSLEFQLEALQVTLSPIFHPQKNSDHIDVSQSHWPIANGPPGLSKPFLYILNSSFLI